MKVNGPALGADVRTRARPPTRRLYLDDLGDILEGKQEAFERGYLENALTSHPLLAPLGSIARTATRRRRARVGGVPDHPVL
jgi:hypothetical protein